jgi:hypothetical protein
MLTTLRTYEEKDFVYSTKNLRHVGWNDLLSDQEGLSRAKSQ